MTSYNDLQVDSGNGCTVLKFREVEEAQLSTVEQRLTSAQPETTTNLLQQSLQEDLAGLDLTVSVTEVQVLHTFDQIDREQNNIEADVTGLVVGILFALCALCTCGGVVFLCVRHRRRGTKPPTTPVVPGHLEPEGTAPNVERKGSNATMKSGQSEPVVVSRL